MNVYDSAGERRPVLPERELPRALPVLGNPMRCWCGLTLGHPWPGRADGAPHPRERARELVPA